MKRTGYEGRVWDAAKAVLPDWGRAQAEKIFGAVLHRVRVKPDGTIIEPARGNLQIFRMANGETVSLRTSADGWIGCHPMPDGNFSPFHAVDHVAAAVFHPRGVGHDHEELVFCVVRADVANRHFRSIREAKLAEGLAAPLDRALFVPVLEGVKYGGRSFKSFWDIRTGGCSALLSDVIGGEAVGDPGKAIIGDHVDADMTDQAILIDRHRADLADRLGLDPARVSIRLTF